MQLIEVNSSSKALPSRAKVSVVYGGTSAEAWMNLPTAPTRAAISELPAVVWVTVGLLATDGFALQVCLLCAERGSKGRILSHSCGLVPD